MLRKLSMVNEGKGRIYAEGRNQTRYLLHLPKDLAEDSIFPFKGLESIFVKVGFNP